MIDVILLQEIVFLGFTNKQTKKKHGYVVSYKTKHGYFVSY